MVTLQIPKDKFYKAAIFFEIFLYLGLLWSQTSILSHFIGTGMDIAAS